MTPAQMLKQLRPPEREATLFDRGPIILVPDDKRISAQELLYKEESEALMRGICPKCGSKVGALLTETTVKFNCSKWPTFHEWQRNTSFITRD